MFCLLCARWLAFGVMVSGGSWVYFWQFLWAPDSTTNSQKELLVKKHEEWKVKVFLLLLDPSIGEELSAEKQCMLGDVVAEFRRLYPDEEALRSDDFLMVLRALALIIKNENIAIENNNAAIRRRAYKTPQTHRMTTSELASWWVFLMDRARRRSLAVRPPPRKTRRLGRPAVRVRKGGGGKWRGWVRLKTFGTRFAADFRRLSASYRRRSPAEDRLLDIMGTRATARVRETGKAGFGDKAHLVRRVARSKARADVVRRLLQPASVEQGELGSGQGIGRFSGVVR